MGSTGSFPVDLVLFGMVAAFLVLRLRGILGRRTGFERPTMPQSPLAAQPSPAPMNPRLEPVPAATAKDVPDPASQVGQTLTRMHAIDATFSPAGFLAGAEKAFRIIVAAFAAGDRQTLRLLLSDDTYNAFEGAITARAALGHVQTSEIRSIERMVIESAELHGTVAAVTVRIVSDQISMTRDQSGHIVVSAEAITEISDIWTFERDLRQPDPTWRLIAAHSA